MPRRSTPRPHLTNLTDMLNAGLSSLAGWLLHQQESAADAVTWLRRKFPGVRLNSINDALNWLRRSESAAATLQAGQVQPRPGEIPVDPSIPSNRGYRYVLRVTFHEPNPLLQGWSGADRTFNRTVVYHSNQLLTMRQLQSQVPSDVREAMRRVPANRRNRYQIPEGFGQFRGTVEVLQLSRRS